MAGDILVQQILNRPIHLCKVCSRCFPVHGLYRFGLTLPALTCCGTRSVQLLLQLRGPLVRPSRSPEPAQANGRHQDQSRATARASQTAFPGLEFAREANSASWTIDVKARADPVIDLPEARSSGAVCRFHKGRRARARRRSRRWLCVWAVLAVQIEGRRKGHVTLDDRLVLVKPLSMNEAGLQRSAAMRTRRRAPRQSRRRARRWALVSVQDVFELFDDAINPRGTDVFSRLRRALMRPDLFGRPERP